MLDTTKCPICGNREGLTINELASTAISCECGRCGDFTVTRLMIAAPIPHDIAPYLSAATRQATQRGQVLGDYDRELP